MALEAEALTAERTLGRAMSFEEAVGLGQAGRAIRIHLPCQM